MLRANLATRPFYNDRLVRVGLGFVGAIALALTVFNAYEVWQLRSRSSEQRQRTEQNEVDARGLRDKARVIRQSIDRAKLDAVQAAAREANQLIERRAFSWTDLFNRFETTMPADVRLAQVQPQFDQEGHMLVAVTVVSRKVEDVDAFIDALEKTGAFRGVLSRQERAQDDGTLRSVIQGFYGVPPAGAAVEAPPASEPDKELPGNATGKVARR
jgi:hypothetical protein